jgi:hypothetical protein
MQPHIRPPSQHAGGRAGRVDQDAVERLALPPAGGCAGIADHDLGVQPQPHQVLADAFGALGIDSSAVRSISRAFEQVAGLAAGCGAGIEHAHPSLEVGQIGGHLRGAVLHGERAILETGHAGDVGAVRQHQGIAQPGMGVAA